MTTISAGDDHAPASSRAAPSDFAAFYRAHFRAVTGLVYSVAADWVVAEEIAQDAFVRAYVHWRTVATHPRADLWVRRVALNRSASAFRRRQAERRATVRTQVRVEADDRSTPVAQDGDAGWLLDHVRRLPRRQAHAVVLVYVEQLDHDEAAEVLGCRPSTLRTHLQRARAALQRSIEEERHHGP
jgi:RNA polymerase sigma-70 factor (ECF subfamily)